jgi:iron complex transport system substrate-binding protein
MDLSINCRKSSKAVLVFILAIFFANQSLNAKEKMIDKRIVSTNLCVDALLIALIGTKDVVAVSSVAGDPRYSLIADEVKSLQKVNFNAEAIYALKPSLVLASNFSSAKTRLALTKLGLEVKLVNYAHSIRDVENNLNYLGELLGASTKAAELIKTIQATKHRLENKVTLEALQYSANKYVNGQHSLISDILRRSGFSRPSQMSENPRAGFLSSEFIIKAEPQLLLLDKNEISSKNGKNSRYNNAIYKLSDQTSIIHVDQKQWSCGSPSVVNLIDQLGKKHSKILREKNVGK